jgi:predicted RNA-binding Zn-ribbon protein involved in translation (DUF1610 family)
MKITDFSCQKNGKRIDGDAFGNNVAFACPNCDHPVLAIARKHQRGSHEGNPSKCRKCGAEYWMEINEAKRKISLREKARRRATPPF